MNIVPFQLIPDRGSIGYKLYQEEMRAKAEASAKNNAPFLIQHPEPERTLPDPVVEDTAPPEEEDVALTAFINAAKVKYKEAGDRTKVEDSVTLGGKVTTAEEKRKLVGNPFISMIDDAFMSILSSLDGYERHIIGVEKLQAKVTDGDMSYLNELTMSQSMLADAKYSVVRSLGGIKRWAEENNTLSETQDFFAEYTQFTRGEKMNLQDLFARFDIA